MKTLAIDCATPTIGVALLEEREIRAEFSLKLGRHHAEVLLPAIETLCRMAGTAPGQIDLLACTVGPGSFTGVRMGISTVKGLSLGLRLPIVGISTLEALSLNALTGDLPVCALLDARKGQVYAGLYRRGEEGLPERIAADRTGRIEAFLTELPAGDIVFVGEGAWRHERLLVQTLGSRAVLAGPDRERIMASAVGLIARKRYRQGEQCDPLTLAPRYLRLSEAEKQRRAP